MSRTVVVGGGIAGASVAYHLAERDREVTLLERGELGAETTARSAAFFGFYGSDVERRMKRYGLALYNEFLADPEADPRHDLVGRLRVATTPAGADALAGERRIGPGAVHERVVCPPLATDRLEAAAHRPNVGFFAPRELAREFAARATAAGAALREGVAVEDVLVEDGRAAGVVTADGELRAGSVVAAAGPWNPRVGRLAGVDLPLTHSLAPVLVLEPSRPLRHTLPIVSHVESGVYARGTPGGRVLVGHVPGEASGELDPDAVADEVPADLREEMREAVATLLPPLADADVVDEWVGVRSSTPDGEPLVGPTHLPGFHVVGFSTSGIQLAPAAGDVLARRLDGESTDLDDTLDPRR